MKQRLLVAAVGVPALLLILLWAPAWATVALVALLSGVGSFELMRAVGGEEWKKLCLLPVFAALSAVWLGASGASVWRTGALAGAFLVVTGSFAAVIFAYGSSRPIHFRTLTAGLFSVFAIPAAFACIPRLRSLEVALVLTPFVGAFLSDTGAFFAGRAFGKRKLAPHVSPHKTVAGCIGGFAGSILGMCVFYLAVRAQVSPELTWGRTVLLGALGSLFGQLGDLSFSVIKREFGIKDYGRVFLTHGGVLDRFDSVLFVAPAYWLLLKIWF